MHFLVVATIVHILHIFRIHQVIGVYFVRPLLICRHHDATVFPFGADSTPPVECVRYSPLVESAALRACSVPAITARRFSDTLVFPAAMLP